MRKHYLEIEYYQNDMSISTLRIIDQRTKNRREKFAKTLKNLDIEFFPICSDFHRQLSIARDLNEATAKLIKLEIKNLLESEAAK